MTAAPKKRGRPRKTAPPTTPAHGEMEQLLDLVRKAHGDAAAGRVRKAMDDAALYQELVGHLETAIRGLGRSR